MRTSPLILMLAAVVAVASTTALAGQAPRNQRLLCGCASSRFLDRGPLDIGEGSLGFWLHGETTIESFEVQEGGKVVPAELPWRIQLFGDDDGVDGENAVSADGSSRFGQVAATGTGDGWLGIVRPGDTVPRDLVQGHFSPAKASPTLVPKLKALWVAAPEDRERRDCGPWRTQRLAFDLVDGSPDVEAFIINSTLVDARHVGAFGIGRVEVCDHGAAITPSTTSLEIVPLTATGVRGEAWRFTVDTDASGAVTTTKAPSTVDRDLLDLGFPVPGESRQQFSLLSVGGMWLGLIAAMIVGAVVGFLMVRFKRRKIAQVVCTACGCAVSVDVLDEKADGFFCPTCGTTGMWKGAGKSVEVSRLDGRDP